MTGSTQLELSLAVMGDEDNHLLEALNVAIIAAERQISQLATTTSSVALADEASVEMRIFRRLEQSLAMLNAHREKILERRS
jgi:hypothetical protein